MKKFVPVVLATMMCVTALVGCSNNKPAETVPSIDVATGPTETELEKSVREYTEGLSVEKKEFSSFEVMWDDSNKVSVGVDSTVESFSPIDPSACDIPGVNKDAVKVTCEDPKVFGVSKRLTYTVSGVESPLWSFFADFDKETNHLKWFELDPKSGYADSETIFVNGICLANTFDEVVQKFGSPDTISTNTKNGKDSICLGWNYSFGYEDNSTTTMYVTFKHFDGNSPSNAQIDNMYVNMKH